MKRPTIPGKMVQSAARGFLTVALFVSIALTGFEVSQSMRRQSDEAREAGLSSAARIARELDLREHAVESLAATAEDILSGRLTTAETITPHLRAVPERAGFAMSAPPGYRAEDLGGLMGEGDPPVAGSEAAAEIDMAFALSEELKLVHGHDESLPWVYYISKRGFFYIFPRPPEGSFLWNHELLKRYDMLPGAAPLKLEGPRTGLSAVYSDTGGKGPMITVSRLVEHHGQIAGDISVDVSVRTLAELLHDDRVPDSTLRLFDPTGADFLGGSRLPGGISVQEPHPSSPIRVGDVEVYILDVNPSGWHVGVVTSRRAMLWTALRQSSLHGLLVLFSLGSLILFVALTRALQLVESQSRHDALTGLYNRRHFDEVAELELAKARRSGTPVGLLILDVDHFKKYNDRLGHYAGDQALRDLATALRGSLRRAGDGVFRLGGEEFAVLASVEDYDKLQQLGDKLCDAVRALGIVHEGSDLGHVSISVGATLVDAAHWVDMDKAYQAADKALYQAKSTGRDRAVVHRPAPIAQAV